MDTAPRRASKMPRIDTDRTTIAEKSTEKQQSALGTICLICISVPDPEQPVGFSYGEKGLWPDRCLFVLDLDAERAKKSGGGEGYVPRNPDMCFDTYALGVSGCCVVGPTLYLFGNANNDLFSYELLPRPAVTTLTRGMLTNVERPMKYPKICPAGIQAPGGKMIVLSSWIVLDEDDNIGKFEMFDPKNKEWEVLPDLLPLLLDAFENRCGLPGFDYNYQCTDVHSYSFINNGPVLLLATELGYFTLDTSWTRSGWLRCNRFEYPLSDLRLMLVPDDDDLALMDWCALHGEENPPRRLVYPGLEDRRNYFQVSRGAGITWLPPSNNRFCIARSHIGPGTMKPHLIIDVCSFDSDVFQSKKNQTQDGDVIPGVTVMERLKFVLGPQEKEDDCIIPFNTNGLFSMIVVSRPN